MGYHEINPEFDPDRLRTFTADLLNDVRALELMLESGLLESGSPRVGAEQELFLIDQAGGPARVVVPILNKLNDSHYTTELGTYNLEFNLDPIPFDGNCFLNMEAQLNSLTARARQAARECGAEILMVGILPTLRKSDVGFDSMSPKPRYKAINDALTRLRGCKEYEVFLHGTDELYIRHDSMMLEACNTSFQVHLQVDPKSFARLYNIAQAVAGPVLAVAVNSPLLFGKRIWHETRIGVFQQATDTRQPHPSMRESLSRVHFGNGWVKNSVLEIFQEDIARFRALLGVVIDENPFEVLQRGGVPQLRALQLHNGTVYRWNRPCYGITEGKPHLRIENRILPSGPTIIDEVANSAFWLGLVHGVAQETDDITQVLDFDDARRNFFTAARVGIDAQFTWVGNKTIPAQTLILEELLPLARKGLAACGTSPEDINRYLDVIEKRTATKQTGAAWQLRSYAALKTKVPQGDCLGALTLAACRNQQRRLPVHEWPLATQETPGDMRSHHRLVEHFMSTDLLTVNPDDPIGLVLSIMHWRRVRHIPVEDSSHTLLGLVDYRSLIRLFNGAYDKDHSIKPVSTIMQTDVPTAHPGMSTIDAIALMCQRGVTCLPVVHEGKLTGIVTQNDFMRIAAAYLEAGLGSEGKKSAETPKRSSLPPTPKPDTT
jgi:CBS domain-containing protein/gamma-glutamyl:cysteine ligase YbdK (ATP-grasp superfamily)